MLDKPEFLYYIYNHGKRTHLDKQVAIIGFLTEGSSIRAIERATGIHRDTIMRLGVKVRQGPPVR